MPIQFASSEVALETRKDGVVFLRSKRPLMPYPDRLGDLLHRSASRAPQRTFLAEKKDGRWSELTYEEALRRAESLAQYFIDRGLGQSTPVMLLSGNSIDHALMTLGCLLAGVPAAPVSPAYSLMAQDHVTLRALFSLLRPPIVFADRPELFRPALRSLDLKGVTLISSQPATPNSHAVHIRDIWLTKPTQAVRKRNASIGPASVAKYLFTSGSTGTPKAVITTHGMLCANQQMISQVWPFLEESPPVLIDWLPWHHCFGGSHNFNLAMNHAGTLYIDGGKPVAELFSETLANLCEVSPTIYFNVPAGFSLLLPQLRENARLRKAFFKRLKMVMFAGAALPEELWKELKSLAAESSDQPPLMATGWGSTETAPLATAVHSPVDDARSIGLPAPGVEIKLLPSGGKQELRVRGPNVTPGYLGRPRLTRQAFDEEGFFKIGDAGFLADPDDPSKGIVFNGRIAEDFKLATGTWVNVNRVRLRILSFAGQLLADAVVTGADRPFLGLLAWPGKDWRREDQWLRQPEFMEQLRLKLGQCNDAHPGSATRIRRVILLSDPPSIDRGEITDKGYLNQRAVLENRCSAVDLLYE
ncbi:MAG: feruloyl-CoA synthase, partial [Acidobacteriota bacterium]